MRRNSFKPGINFRTLEPGKILHRENDRDHKFLFVRYREGRAYFNELNEHGQPTGKVIDTRSIYGFHFSKP